MASAMHADTRTTAAAASSAETSPQQHIHFSPTRARSSSTSSTSNQRKSRSSSSEIAPLRALDGTFNRSYQTASTDRILDDPPETTDKSPKHTATGSSDPLQNAALPGTDVMFADLAPQDKGKKSGNSSKSNLVADSEPVVRWYNRLLEKYGSVSLENKGSVARDHLALERTFLAWLRTSLAFASIGIAVTQLFRLNTSIAAQSQAVEQDYIRRRRRAGGDLPLSPLVGHAIDIDVVQQMWGYEDANSAGTNLLDQLTTLNPTAFDADAAAKLRHLGKPLGATFLAISIVILLIGCHRYFEAQHWVIRGKFPASRGSVALAGFIAAGLIITSLVVVLVVAPSSFEKK